MSLPVDRMIKLACAPKHAVPRADVVLADRLPWLLKRRAKVRLAVNWVIEFARFCELALARA